MPGNLRNLAKFCLKGEKKYKEQNSIFFERPTIDYEDFDILTW